MAGDDVKDLIPFPQSRVRPSRSEPARDLGVSPLARQLGVPRPGLSGHWCSRCKGIWQGLLLEAECLTCGNRQG